MAREVELRKLLDHAREEAGTNYDCLVPISGGKDSCFQLHVLCKVYGMKPLTTTFMDYLMPTVNEIPPLLKDEVVTPSPFTPLGAKGCGEGAIHTTPAAVMCAVNDALSPLGIRSREVPATPNRIWNLIREPNGE